MAVEGPNADITRANALAASKPKEAAALYRAVLARTDPVPSAAAANKENAAVDPALKVGPIIDAATAEAIAAKETATIALATILRDQGNAQELGALLLSTHSTLSHSAKAKVEKTLRTLMDLFVAVPDHFDYKIKVIKEIAAWAATDKRTLLNQAFQTRLVSVYLDSKNYSEALALIATLLRDLKRLDDKNALIEVQLLESRIYHALRNLAKSRAALTSARTSANAVYCPPLIQAQLDIQSGILHAEERDYKTAYSYFYETLESFSAIEDKRSLLALKYMLLCKIMLNQSDEVHAIVNGKMALKWTGSEIDAMQAVAQAHLNRSLLEFEQVLAKYQAELRSDPIVKNHLAALYETLLEQNLLRIIEPFSRVEVAHVAELVRLPTATVENKLSKMILDKVFEGVLDQGNGWLEVFEKPVVDKTYELALDTIKSMGNVVESLYTKAAMLA